MADVIYYQCQACLDIMLGFETIRSGEGPICGSDDNEPFLIHILHTPAPWEEGAEDEEEAEEQVENLVEGGPNEAAGSEGAGNENDPPKGRFSGLNEEAEEA